MRERIRSKGAVNPMYEDTIFRKLFHEKKSLLSLYNAINETNYENPQELEAVTMDNAIYMGMKNDFAFVLDCQMYLYEHSATINTNMSQHFMNYIASEYRNILRKISFYTETLIELPNITFIVLYNGLNNVPERMVLNLSDAYEEMAENSNLELIVTQLNLNPGFNEQIKKTCQILNEYMQYVEHVRTFAESMWLEDAVEHAVDYCMGKGILGDFLSENREETIKLSLFEYIWEQDLQMIRDQMKKDAGAKAWKEGCPVGRAEGINMGIELSRVVNRMAGEGKIMTEIAADLNVSEEIVSKILKEE